MVSMLTLLRLARSARAAVGCFSVYDAETIAAVVEAASLERVPVALSIDNDVAERGGLDALTHAAITAAREAGTPMTVHRNHARSLDCLRHALALGFPSVMFDGSHLPLEMNMQETRKAAALAHKAGAVIEGELGPVTMAGGQQGMPEEQKDANGDAPHAGMARYFVAETGVDILAVSIATAGQASLHQLALLCSQVACPVALHNASRLGPDSAALARRHGVLKVNVHSEIKRAMQDTAAAQAEHAATRQAVISVVRRTLQSLAPESPVPGDS